MENDELDLELEQTEPVETEDTVLEVEEDTTDWKAEALKQKAINQRLQKKTTKSITKESYDDEVVKDVQYLKTLEAKRQYGYEQGMSPEETDFVFKFSGGKPTKEVLDNPFVKSGLEGFRASKRLEANTPSSSGASPVFGNKPFEELSETDRAKAFESRVKSLK